MRRFLLLALLFVPLRLAAYVSECGTAGTMTRSMGPASGTVTMVLTGTTLRLMNNYFAESIGSGPYTQPLFGPPSVALTGVTIFVTQSYTPPRLISGVNASPTNHLFCHFEEVNVGPLPEQTYAVVWTYVADGGDSSLNGLVRVAANPCTNPPARGSSNVSLTLTPIGTTHLHYESTEAAFEPVYGTPAVTFVTPGVIQVKQPLSDIADSTIPGMPMATICHAEDLDVGVVPPSGYFLFWDYDATFGGAPKHFGLLHLFVWSGSALQCSEGGILSSVPAIAAATGPITLILSRATIQADPLVEGATSVVDGHVIRVSDFIDGTHPQTASLASLHCSETAITIPGLEPGHYSVPWLTYHGLNTFDLTVFQGRRRAAR